MKRILAAVLVLTIVTFFTGCLSPASPSSAPGTPLPAGDGMTTTASTGTIRVLVTDAPGNVSSVNISVSKVEVHKSGSNGEPGAWTSLNVTDQDQPLVHVHRADTAAGGQHADDQEAVAVQFDRFADRVHQSEENSPRNA